MLYPSVINCTFDRQITFQSIWWRYLALSGQVQGIWDTAASAAREGGKRSNVR